MFVTCISDALFPPVAESMMRLLARYGIKLEFPPVQTCCGQPAYNSGYWDEARTTARTIITAFEDSDFVVSPSGSCTYMVHHYSELFKDEPQWLAKAKELQSKLYEFTQFLVQVLDVKDVGARFPHKVTYHPSCHGSRLLGVKDEPMQLLEHVKGLEFVPTPFAQDCCGFGGTFAVKLPGLSTAMADDKIDRVQESGAQLLVSSDMACLMHLAGRIARRGLDVRTLHLATLLEEATRAPNQRQAAPAREGAAS